jgi:hypothetical protein
MVPEMTVITKDVDPGDDAASVVPVYDAVTVDAAKNELGYIKVIVLAPADRAPPALGVNFKYAVQPVLPATRLAASMVKLTAVTWLPMLPAFTLSDTLLSKFV